VLNLSNKNASKSGVILVLLSLFCSIIALAYWANYTYNASVEYDEAKAHELQTRENLAQAYADMPWTMEHIIKDINDSVASGEFDRAIGDWLIQRVEQLRGP
jgi:hypothetical protein